MASPLGSGADEITRQLISVSLLSQVGWVLVSQLLTRLGDDRREKNVDGEQEWRFEQSCLDLAEQVVIGFVDWSPQGVDAQIKTALPMAGVFGPTVQNRISQTFCSQYMRIYDHTFPESVSVEDLEARMEWLWSMLDTTQGIFPSDWTTLGDFVEQVGGTIGAQLNCYLRNETSPVDAVKYFTTWKKCMKFEEKLALRLTPEGGHPPGVSYFTHCFENSPRLLDIEDACMRALIDDGLKNERWQGIDTSRILDSAQDIFTYIHSRVGEYRRLLTTDPDEPNRVIMRIQHIWRRQLAVYAVLLIGHLGSGWSWAGGQSSESKLQELLVIHNTAEYWSGLCTTVPKAIGQHLGAESSLNFDSCKELFGLLSSKSLECVLSGVLAAAKNEFDSIPKRNWDLDGEASPPKSSHWFSTGVRKTEKVHDGISNYVHELEDSLTESLQPVLEVVQGFLTKGLIPFLLALSDSVGDRLAVALQQCLPPISPSGKQQMLQDMLHVRAFLRDIPTNLLGPSSALSLPPESISNFESEIQQRQFLPLAVLDLLNLQLSQFAEQCCLLDTQHNRISPRLLLRARGCTEGEIDHQMQKIAKYQSVLQQACSDTVAIGPGEVERSGESRFVEATIGDFNASNTLSGPKDTEPKYRISRNGKPVAQFKRSAIFHKVWDLIRSAHKPIEI